MGWSGERRGEKGGKGWDGVGRGEVGREGRSWKGRGGAGKGGNRREGKGEVRKEVCHDQLPLVWASLIPRLFLIFVCELQVTKSWAGPGSEANVWLCSTSVASEILCFPCR